MAFSKLGQSRAKVLSYVKKRLKAGDPPSYREIQLHLGFKSVQSVNLHIDKLVANGDLIVKAGRARGLRLPKGNVDV